MRWRTISLPSYPPALVTTSSTPATPLKLYTLYGPPEHKDRTIHRDKAQADRDHENDHFDGHTSE